MKPAETLGAVVQPPAKPQNETSRVGPVPIDPADFKFISGGSPRTGWLDAAAEPRAEAASRSPRTGW